MSTEISRHDSMLIDPLERREFVDEQEDDELEMEAADDPCNDDDGFGDY